MKTNFVVDIMMSLTIEEITDLKKLADKQSVSIEHCARTCMMEKCKELLLKELFKPYAEDMKPKEEVVLPISE